MRFREVLPVNLAEVICRAVNKPDAAKLRYVKFFPRPKALDMCVLESADRDLLAATPLVCTHMFFRPLEPVAVRTPGKPVHLQWHLRLYYPLSTAKASFKPSKWPLPRGKDEKAAGYDSVLNLNPIRARYSFFIDKNECAYAYVPVLMGSPVHIDETDVRYLSHEVWDWCVSRARPSVSQQVTANLAMLSEEDGVRALAAVGATEWRGADIFLLYWGLMAMYRNEEQALGTFARSKFTLAQLQESYQLLAGPSPALGDDEEGSCPAIGGLQSWGPPPLLSKLGPILAKLRRDLQDAALQRELRLVATMPDAVIDVPAQTLRALAVLDNNPLLARLATRGQQQQQQPH